jgi:hypothetical protein
VREKVPEVEVGVVVHEGAEGVRVTLEDLRAEEVALRVRRRGHSEAARDDTVREALEVAVQLRVELGDARHV